MKKDDLKKKINALLSRASDDLLTMEEKQLLTKLKVDIGTGGPLIIIGQLTDNEKDMIETISNKLEKQSINLVKG